MCEQLTEKEMHRLRRPPAEEHEERHPPQRELDRQIDRAAAREHRGHLHLLVRDSIVHRLAEEDDRDGAVRREGHEWQEDEPEPLLPDPARLPHVFNALDQLRRENNEA